MLCFLGIVTADDLRKGKIRPSFVLTYYKINAPNNTGLIMVATDQNRFDYPKLLFDEPWGNYLYEQYVANYRIKQLQKEAKDGKRKEYFIDGGVFYFPCNEYGEQLKRHPAIYVQSTAFLRFGSTFRQPIEAIRLQLARDAQKSKGDLKEQMLYEVTYVPLEETVFPTGFFYKKKDLANQKLAGRRHTGGGLYGTDEKRIQRSQFRQRERACGAEKHRQGYAELPELGLGMGRSKEEVPRCPLRDLKDLTRPALF